MSNTKEKVIENQIKNLLKKKKIYFFKNHGSMFTEPGRPDIVACYYGIFIAIEVKREKGGIQSEAQKFHEANIIRNRGIYLLSNDVDQVNTLLERIEACNE